MATEVIIGTVDALKAEIQAYIAEAEATQLERINAVMQSAGLSPAEKMSNMKAIAEEKYSVDAIIKTLKPTVTFNGKQFELPKIAPLQKATGGGSVSKSAGRFPVGSLIKLHSNGVESGLYEVLQSGKVRDEDGNEVSPSKAVLDFKLSLMNKTEEQFREEYELQNGRPFAGYAGLSNSMWVVAS